MSTKGLLFWSACNVQNSIYTRWMAGWTDRWRSGKKISAEPELWTVIHQIGFLVANLLGRYLLWTGWSTRQGVVCFCSSLWTTPPLSSSFQSDSSQSHVYISVLCSCLHTIVAPHHHWWDSQAAWISLLVSGGTWGTPLLWPCRWCSFAVVGSVHWQSLLRLERPCWSRGCQLGQHDHWWLHWPRNRNRENRKEEMGEKIRKNKQTDFAHLPWD